MPLKIRVKPEGKICAGGAVLKNVGKRPADLLVLSDSPVLREDYMMNIERKDDSETSSVYFLLQVIYLFKGKGQPLDTLVLDTLKNFSRLHPHLAADVDQVLTLLEAGESFKALRHCHKLLDNRAKTDAPPSSGDPLAATSHAA
ncbi:MAG: hypothetical protein HGA90_01285 [Alphaproteobacteria bacterium]|nr:hypothetical protein [Alphaproteobacteria bacterium]